MSEPQYWLPHKEFSWVPGVKKKDAGDSVTFTAEGGEVITVPAKEAETLSLVQPDQLAGIDDVCALGVVHEGALVHTVRVRYTKDLIYTRVARTLIAVNPFSLLPIYGAEIIDKYAAAYDTTELPPHAYAIGQDALEGLRSHGNQAVLISGESGAGKTESAKLILAFVTDAVRKHGEQDMAEHEEKIEDRVLQTNAVLEAFGNAMTARNNNSSRFGKWLDLRFSQDATGLLGCNLTSYLLETTRCIGQANNERSFHIFYQLINAKKDFPDLNLLEPKKYRYLKDGQLKAPGVDDKSRFGELIDALKVLGFDDDQRTEIFRIVTGVLNLGNVDFKDTGGEDESCKVTDEAQLQSSADILGMEADGLKKCITERKITIGKDTTVKPLRAEQARSARDSMARLLYGRLFLWLIGCMNKRFSLGDDEDDSPGWGSPDERLLGVLDIAGFESFEHNSLEQLLINLSNEHLHQNFNEFVFKAEVAESEREGIPVPSAIDFTDNADVLAFIDSRGGCLDLLDETMVVPKCTDKDFVSKVLKAHDKNPVLVAQKFAQDKFGIRHFAGEVVYTTDGWLDKNSDSPPGDAPDLLNESSLEVLQCFGAEIMAEALAGDGGSGDRKAGSKAPMKRKAKSVCSVFRTSLKALMEKISKAEPHYVLCIKPNMQKVPKKFNPSAVLEQLLLTGVLSAVQIRQMGFAYRIVHDEFAFEYRCIVDAASSNKGKKGAAQMGRDDVQRLVEALPDALQKLGHGGVTSADFAVGMTKVFFKFSAYKKLQDGRRQALWSSAVRIQCRFRGYGARQAIKERKEIRGRIRECLAPLELGNLCLPGGDQRGKDAAWPAAESCLVRVKGGDVDKTGSELLDKLELVLHEAQEMDFRCPDVVQAERIFTRLQMELEIADEVTQAKKSVDPIQVEKALSRAQSVALPPPGRITDLEQRIKNLRAQLPLKKALETALATGPTAASVTDEQLVELQDIVDAVAAAGIVSGGGADSGEERRISSEDYEAYTYAQFLSNFGEIDGKKAWESAQPEQAWIPELGATELWKSLLELLTAIEEKKRKEAEEAEKRAAEEREAELRAARSAEEEARKKEEEANGALAKAAEDEKKAAEEAVAKAAAEAAEAKKKEEEAAAKAAAEAQAQENARKTRKSILKPNKLGVPGEEGGDEELPQFGRKTARMKTITGLAVAEQVKIITGLKKAVDEYNIEALEELLKKATENGIKEDFAVDEFSLETARKMFQQLQGQDFLKQEIERARQEARKPATPVMALQRLEHLSKQLGQIPGNEEEAKEASRFVQKALVTYSKDKRDDKTILDSEDQEEVDLASKIFGDLSSYARLKPAAAWKARLRGGGSRASVGGWRQSTWVGRRTVSRKVTGRYGGGGNTLGVPGQEPVTEGMLIHGKVIVESLTWPPAGYDPQEYDAAATQNFRNILVAMGDRAAQECQRKASIDAVVMLAKESNQLRDEVYMQVLKQLIKNPNPRSVGLGWELLYTLCQDAKPSDEIIEFVRIFITKGMEQLDFSGVSYFFTLRLARLLGCRGDFNNKDQSKA